MRCRWQRCRRSRILPPMRSGETFIYLVFFMEGERTYHFGGYTHARELLLVVGAGLSAIVCDENNLLS